MRGHDGDLDRDVTDARVHERVLDERSDLDEALVESLDAGVDARDLEQVGHEEPESLHLFGEQLERLLRLARRARRGAPG